MRHTGNANAPYIVVKKNDGGDLYDKFKNFAGFEPLWLDQGDYTVPAPLSFPLKSSSGNYVIALKGSDVRKTRIIGSSGCANDFVLKTNQDNWVANTSRVRLSLDGIEIRGSGNEYGCISAPYTFPQVGDLWLGGSFAAGGGDNRVMAYFGGSSGPTEFSSIGNINFNNTNDVFRCLSLWLDSCNVGALTFNMYNAGTTGTNNCLLLAQGVNLNAGLINALIGNTKSVTYFIKTYSLALSINKLCLGMNNTPTLLPKILWLDDGSSAIIGSIEDMAGARISKDEATFLNLQIAGTIKMYFNTDSTNTTRTTTITNAGTWYPLSATYCPDQVQDTTNSSWARIIVNACGNGTGTTRQIRVSDAANNVYGGVSWTDDSGTPTMHIGAWTDISGFVAAARTLKIEGTSSGAGEILSWKLPCYIEVKKSK